MLLWKWKLLLRQANAGIVPATSCVFRTGDYRIIAFRSIYVSWSPQSTRHPISIILLRPLRLRNRRDAGTLSELFAHGRVVSE